MDQLQLHEIRKTVAAGLPLPNDQASQLLDEVLDLENYAASLKREQDQLLSDLEGLRERLTGIIIGGS